MALVSDQAEALSGPSPAGKQPQVWASAPTGSLSPLPTPPHPPVIRSGNAEQTPGGKRGLGPTVRARAPFEGPSGCGQLR